MSVLSVRYLRLYDEDKTNFSALTGAFEIPANFTLALPDDAGVAGQVLSTDGVGTLSWVDAESANTAYYEFLTTANFRIGNSGTFMTEVVNSLTGGVSNTQLATAESIKNYITDKTTTVTITGGTITSVTINNLVQPLSVEDGGTGANTVVQNAVMYGLTANTIGFANGSPGEIFQLAANSTPIFNVLDGGTF